VIETLSTIPTLLAHVPAPGVPADSPAEAGWFNLLILLFPLASCALCGVYAALGLRNKLAGWTTVLALALSFVSTLSAYVSLGPDSARVVHSFDWITIAWGSGAGQSLDLGFTLYLDSLTWLWMLFVTGLGALIALYSVEYMSDDVSNGGYNRYFAFFSLFVFMMAALVMGGNLLLLYLGWEGVGLCSYLLIGYYYGKPSAVAAAKKAFIVNRIGDVGLAIGLMLTFVHFGTLDYPEIFRQVGELQAGAAEGDALPSTVWWIPLFLMVGAFGKSAQLPLYVWLPDAMEGPTPVSALIHAATMVTAGVYLIARFLPLFALNPTSLAIVAWVGGLTALLAATIGMAQYDIKRVMAYSTVSQLGYMFLGLGVLTAAGAAYHVFTHAFFKAALFLSCGAVMHGFAGQLDLRRLSGVMKMRGWRITGATMLVGCLCLAGFPFTSGFFSKDMILAEAFSVEGPGFMGLAVIALATAGLTAYYAFRVFFRVFMGPVEHHPGEEGHGAGAAHETEHQAESHGGGFHPHAPGWAINVVQAVLIVGALAAAIPYFIDTGHHGWVGDLVHQSTAGMTEASAAAPHGAERVAESDAAHGGGFFADPHQWMYYASSLVGIVGILIAWGVHMTGRRSAGKAPVADKLKAAIQPVSTWAERKWYVDEIYDWTLRKPLHVLAHIFYIIDREIVDGLLVNGLGAGIPRGLGGAARPSQSGLLQNYAASMAAGVVLLLIVVWVLL